MTIRYIVAGFGLAAFVITASAIATARSSGNAHEIAHGRYIVEIGGCNDCHTPGYAESGGHVPEKKWLVGNSLGFHGPWGTTYPSNLRLFMQDETRSEWIKFAHSADLRPPMPNWALHAMTKDDLGTVYAFIRSLGAAGKPAPGFVPPGQTPKEPYVSWPTPTGH